jgi:protein-tyrosine phosphatase
MKSILVVCEGNICRSPMAQGLLAAALPKTQVQSAGLGALVGMPADETAMRLMQSRSIDISEHRAVQINRQMCLESDMVLVMDLEQRKRIEELYPQVCGRVFRVGEYNKRDIPDPYRQSELAFREVLSLIDEGVREWLHRIHRL